MRLAPWAAASLGVAVTAACADPADGDCAETQDDVASVVAAQCGATLDFEPVNEYGGDFPNVQAREDAVVLVNGNCTGTIIDGGVAGQFILTAGHCVGLGDEALLVLNHEKCADGVEGAWGGRVVERSVEPDYALITLDGDPGVVATRLGRELTERLAIIQHPIGRPKVIADGLLLDEDSGVLRYLEIDTLAGGSGAGVLNSNGRLVGVHTSGDCYEDGGSNAGWTAAEIVSASARLDDAVLDI